MLGAVPVVKNILQMEALRELGTSKKISKKNGKQAGFEGRLATSPNSFTYFSVLFPGFSGL